MTGARQRAVRSSWPAAVVACLALGCAAGPVVAQASGPTLVGTLTVYREIATELLGDRGQAVALTGPRHDAHDPAGAPPLTAELATADVLVETEAGLDGWLEAAVEASGNPRLGPGGQGRISVARALAASGGDSTRTHGVHALGNPHLHADPLQAITIADAIARALGLADPANADEYLRRREAFEDRIHRRLFGEALVELVGGAELAARAERDELDTYLADTLEAGTPLLARLGGWLASAACLRDKAVVTYHDNWRYFAERFGLQVAGHVEPVPGTPPEPARLAEIIGLMQRERIRALWVADYFDQRIPSLIAERAGAEFFYVPLYTGGALTGTDYFALVDTWINSLKSAFPDCDTGDADRSGR